jgi:hypothetical protein
MSRSSTAAVCIIDGCHELTRNHDRHCQNHRKSANAVSINAVRIEAVGGAARIIDRSGNMYDLRVDNPLVAREIAQILSASSAATEWSCSRCTYNNKPDSLSCCEMCDGPKPTEKLAAPVQPESAPVKPEERPAENESPTVAEQEGDDDSDPISVSALAANGDHFELGNVQRSQTVASVKEILAQKSGFAVSAQQLFVLDDKRSLEDLSLKNEESLAQVMTYTELLTELKLAVMCHNRPKWVDNKSEFKGKSITVSEDGRIATQTQSSSAIRSQEPILPNTGVHCFEYTYRHKDLSSDGEKLSVYLMVGVVQASVDPKSYQGDWTIGNSTGKWWGLASGGDIHAGAKRCSKTLPKKHDREVIYGNNDKIGFAIDTDNGWMQFYLDGALIEGSKIEGITMEEPLYLVGCPRANAGHGTVLELGLPESEYPIT